MKIYIGTQVGNHLRGLLFYYRALHSSCNTDTCGLPEMFTLCSQACSLRALGGHFRQTTSTHVTTIKCYIIVYHISYTVLHCIILCLR